MANQSFVTVKTGEGFNRYCDIVRNILQAHESIKDGYYTASNAAPVVDVTDAASIIANLTTTTASGPSRYNIDEDGATQNALLSTFITLRDKLTESYSQTATDAIFQPAVSKLQKHLKSLIDAAGNTFYASVNDYYYQNINESRRKALGGANNLLNGGYYFTSDWRRMSVAAGVTYSTAYDA